MWHEANTMQDCHRDESRMHLQTEADERVKTPGGNMREHVRQEQRNKRQTEEKSANWCYGNNKKQGINLKMTNTLNFTKKDINPDNRFSN